MRAAATICPAPLLLLLAPSADWNVTVGSHGEYFPTLIATAAWCVNAAVSKAAWWPFDLESGVRVTCEVIYLCANFSLSRPLCSRLGPDVRDRETSDVRQTDRRQTASLLNAIIKDGEMTIRRFIQHFTMCTKSRPCEHVRSATDAQVSCQRPARPWPRGREVKPGHRENLFLGADRGVSCAEGR